ncbi:MAG: hypothetical protein MK089_13300, partial [Phycisphaerales bacterium]|nr:hypothetical protein [Phycisphaerales bacterium]
MRFVLLFMACIGVLAYSASADVIIVPDDYATIQGAIDAANTGDDIRIRAGLYYENEIKPN